MKQRKIKKNVIALLLAVAMIVTSFPVFSHEVHAAGNQLPTKGQFATVDELKSFNTNDNDGTKNPAKVYFGNNNQQWWIVGSQQDQGLTLYAVSPLAREVQFNPTKRNGTYEGKTVLANHYGASGIKKTLKDLETSYFTDTEQGLMNVTTIYTNDTIDNTVYSTTDKLYFAYGGFGQHHITVGTNSENSLNDGLHIDMGYWGNVGEYIWLRTPYHNHISKALIADPDFVVRDGWVDYDLDLKPAFEVNLSSVIFASTAPAAISDGSLALSDTFTLRYKADNLGLALVSYDKSKVILNNVSNDTYLVVQNSAGAKAKQITSEKEVLATDMGLDSFANCKVWLETTNTDERMTYATLATLEQGYSVNINASDGLVVTNGVQGVGQGNAITDITIKVNEGYYLPDNYTNTIQGLNGLTVKDFTQYGFTISGTPTSDVNITLPAATVLPKADIPVVELKTTATSITATVTNHKTEFGDIEYKWDGGNWEKDKNTLSDLQAETTYQIAVRFTGNGFYQMSDECSINITTLKDGNNVVVSPNEFTTTYTKELKLSDLALPQGWSWENEDTSLSAGTNSYPAVFDTTNLESTTDFSGVEGYDASTHKVTRNVNVIVNKADSNIMLIGPSLTKNYDGNAVSEPGLMTQGSNGAVTIKWQEKVADEWKDLDAAPINVGTYRVVLELEGNANYNPASKTSDFVISQATNTWQKELKIENWTYGDEAKKPTAKAQFGEVIFTYSKEENGTYTSKVPVNAGTYYVKASVEGTKNYTGLEKVLKFNISKADTTLTFEKDNIDKVYDQNAILNPNVNKNGSSKEITYTWYIKDGDNFKQLENAPSDVGTYKVVVSVLEDSNYNGQSIEKTFAISIANNTWQEELKIENWTYGDEAKKPTAKAQFGDVTYTYSKEENGTYTSNEPNEAGTWYVKASVEGTTNYTGLEAKVPFEIAKASSTIKFKDNLPLNKIYDTNAVVLTDEHVEKTVSTGKVTFTFEKKVNDQWEMVDEAVEVGTYRVTANLAEDNNHISATSDSLEFTIHKADSNVTITTSSLNKIYDGNEVSAPEYTTTGSDGAVTIKWQEKSMTTKSEWLDLDKAPSNAGTYRVVVELAGNDNYNPISANLEFEISQANNTWLEELKIEDWTYGDEAKEPSAKAQFGDVTYTYSKEKDGTYTDEVPVNAGTYYVKATVEGTENYTDLEAIVSFEIAKAVPLYEEVTGLVLGQGQALSTIVLPENFKWVDETIVGDKLGTHCFEAIYTPDDTDNYLTINVEIEVEVVPVPEKLNHVPTIKADDQTITIGDEFDALKGVSATDYEDGELKVEVIKNTVNTSKVDEYEVTYKVVDSKGATVTKTIKVKVLEAIEDKEVLEDKIDEIINKDDYTQESYDEYLEALEKAKDVLNNPNASKEEIQEALANLEAAMNKLQKVENTPETGDQTNIYLYTSMITLTSILFVYLSLKKRKTNLSK